MRLIKMMLCLGTVTLAVGMAETHFKLTLSAPTWVGDAELKPGVYKVEMQGDKAVFKDGKTVVEAPAAIINSSQKYPITAVETGAGSKITAIDLGGTSTKIVIKSGTVTTAGN